MDNHFFAVIFKLIGDIRDESKVHMRLRSSVQSIVTTTLQNADSKPNFYIF